MLAKKYRAYFISAIVGVVWTSLPTLALLINVEWISGPLIFISIFSILPLVVILILNGVFVVQHIQLIKKDDDKVPRYRSMIISHILLVFLNILMMALYIDFFSISG